MAATSEWIQQLLDGELDPLHEQALFSALASNSDVRSELKQQLAIRHTVQNDRMALLPPAHLTNAVFSGLGFTAPLAGAVAGAAGGGLVMQWLSRLGLPVASAAAAVGLTLAVGSSEPATETVQTTSTEQPAAAVAGPTVSVPAPSTPSVAPEVTRLRRELASVTAALRQAQAQIRRMGSAMAEREEATRRDIARQRDAVVAMPEPVRSVEAPQPVTLPTAELATPAVSTVALTNTLQIVSTSQERPITLESFAVQAPSWTAYPAFMVQVRGMATSPTTELSVQPQTVWYDDMSIALLYQTSDRIAIGMEAGNETFPQVFEGQRNGQQIKYEQQPSSGWAGAFLRYSFAPLGGGFTPFAQVLGGGTKFGPLGRATVGVQYSPAGPLTFLLGVEGTGMAYQFQNSWFTSSKIGFTYGVAVRF